ncbi:MAG: hypothetical protein AVDCRST_MAG93-239 [uncultured Chloroflexia bacterium]|uniref:Uncharacterized protein n=1 Tax=uncultured Chloroflexia bacterium TaxID=1672391 RepID=A0A6J4H6A2_9CHLR|nr:MAG: hypothetical protein AVDCRST_MAG93-239 [uncultured Chloroflexia bacterium]
MTNEKKDQGSDASRSNPETADHDREQLKKHAEQGIEKAMGGDSSSEEYPEQDLSEGSRGVEHGLGRREKSDNKDLDNAGTKPNTPQSSPGSEAAEPSPDER